MDRHGASPNAPMRRVLSRQRGWSLLQLSPERQNTDTSIYRRSPVEISSRRCCSHAHRCEIIRGPWPASKRTPRRSAVKLQMINFISIRASIVSLNGRYLGNRPRCQYFRELRLSGCSCYHLLPSMHLLLRTEAV